MMTTVVTTTTAASSAVMSITLDQAVALGVVATVLLIAFLVLKELLVAYAAEPGVLGTWRERAARFYAAGLNVAVVPLFIVFALIVVTKVMDVL